jgi:small subunit ribosomal protein S30e
LPTHGSITKAGKVRSQTPKIDARERHSTIPRIRGKNNAKKRLILDRKPGQNWMTGRRRR